MLWKLAVAAATLFSPAAAQAALPWCDIVPALPSFSSFEESAAALDKLSTCQSRPQGTSHLKAWRCSDKADGDVVIILMRVLPERGPGGPVYLTIGADNVPSLSVIQACANSSLRITGGGGDFDPGSLPLMDRISIVKDYRTQTVFLLSMADGRSSIVAFSPNTIDGQDMRDWADQAEFGITRRPYPSTEVLVAGKNLATSRATDVVQALQQRGSRITKDDNKDRLRIAYLTPPVGLEGVQEVRVIGYNDHMFGVIYEVGAGPAFTDFVKLLDEKYGAAQAVRSKDCTSRVWHSGDVRVDAQRCAAKAQISFTNEVTQDQFAEYGQYLKRQPQPPARKVDPDNF